MFSLERINWSKRDAPGGVAGAGVSTLVCGVLSPSVFEMAGEAAGVGDSALLSGVLSPPAFGVADGVTGTGCP